MGKLIDADALIEKCGGWYTEEGTEEGFIGTVKQLLELQPEAVVRCKDCKHRYEDDCSMRFVEVVQVDDDGYIDHEILYNDNTKDYGHCDRGERRTDD